MYKMYSKRTYTIPHKRSLIDLEMCNAPHKVSAETANRIVVVVVSPDTKSRMTACKLVCLKQSMKLCEGFRVLFRQISYGMRSHY